LLKGLKAQTADFDLILIDNTANQFKSAAEGLNHGGRGPKGEYIMFVHQDVVLEYDSFPRIETILDALPNLGIAGAAGCIENVSGVVSNMSHGTPPEPVGNIPVTAPMNVQTLDECLVVVSKDTFNRLRFDEETCDGWHLYAVDYSLSVKACGLDAYVVPMAIYHKSSGLRPTFFLSFLSPGPVQRDYYNTLRKVLSKHKDQYRLIFTTCGTWNTRSPLFLQRVRKWGGNKIRELKKGTGR
jgi:GT2 family glycosyltransferase